jgi:hypothetical protein
MSAPDLKALTKVTRQSGDLAFAIGAVVVSAILLSMIGDQTTWANGKKLFLQPAFWPAVALVGLVFTGSIYAIGSLRAKRDAAADRSELLLWLRAIEFPIWFMGYVFIVPVLGYLPATLLFCVSLTFRMGYRSAKILWSSAAMAVVIVVLFKSFLKVRVPGGDLYEIFPSAIRNFLITYL